MQLKIADISISYSSKNGGDFQTGPEYQPFLSDAQPNALFQVHCCQYLPADLEPIFDSGNSWSLYRDAQKRIVLLNYRLGEPLPFRAAVFAPDFLSGDVYIGNAHGERLPYPLPNPMDAVLFAHLLARGRGVLLHACGVSMDGQGIIFAGQSGAGKSTLAALWKAQDGVTVLNDDRVIVREREGQFWVYGTPWYGSERATSPLGVPVRRIFIIRHADQNESAPLAPPDSAARLLVRSFPTHWDAEGMAFTIGFLGQLCQAVPCHDLGFVPDTSIIDWIRCTALT